MKKSSNDVVYITYSSSLEASLAILSSNNLQVNNQILKVCFGMTNFCRSFLLGKPCRYRKCTYMHKVPQAKECMFRELSYNREQKKISEEKTIEYFLELLPLKRSLACSKASQWSVFPSKETAYKKISEFLQENHSPFPVQYFFYK